MSFVENIIVPIVILAVYLSLGGWVLYILFWIFRKFFPNFRWYFKYGIMKRNYNPKDVELCVKAIEEGKNETKFKMQMLIKGKSMKKSKELLFLYKIIKKKIKGGEDDE